MIFIWATESWYSIAPEERLSLLSEEELEGNLFLYSCWIIVPSLNVDVPAFTSFLLKYTKFYHLHIF